MHRPVTSRSARSLVAALFFAISPCFVFAGPFEQMSITALGGKSETTWHGQMDIQAVNFELAHTISPRYEVGVAVAPMSIWEPRNWFGNESPDGNQRVMAISGLALGRMHFFTDAERLSAYAEVSGGPMWAERQVPAATSRFNFTTQFGAGLILLPWSRYPVMLGWRYLHISNGGYSPRNPGLNVQSIVIGTRIRIATPPRH